VLRSIILLEPPVPSGVEMQRRLDEVVLQDIHVARCIELTDKDLRLPHSLRAEAAPEGDALRVRHALHQVVRIEPLAARTLHPHAAAPIHFDVGLVAEDHAVPVSH